MTRRSKVAVIFILVAASVWTIVCRNWYSEYSDLLQHPSSDTGSMVAIAALRDFVFVAWLAGLTLMLIILAVVIWKGRRQARR